MKCDEFQDQIPRYLRWELSAAEKAAFESHVADCVQCREALEDLTWLRNGLRASQDALAVGHIANRLLLRYIEAPDDLPAHTVDFIRSHLSTCDDCRETYDDMTALAGIELDVPASTPVRARLREFQALSRRD